MYIIIHRLFPSKGQIVKELFQIDPGFEVTSFKYDVNELIEKAYLPGKITY